MVTVRRTLTTVVMMAMLATLVAVPSAAQDGPQVLGAAIAQSAGPASASYQASGCFVDGTGDVRRGINGPVEAAPVADATGFCIDYNQSSLGVSMTVPQGTDPASDPVWNDFGAAAVFSYETPDGTYREVQLSKQQGNQAFEYLVLEGQFLPRLVCSGNAAFESGTYRASVPADCVGAADTIEVIAAFLYDRNGEGEDLIDAAPADGDRVAVPRTAPSGADSVDRLAGGSRVETAIRISQASYADGQADAVVVAFSDNFPDALVAGPLAVARRAPLLLTPRNSVPDAVLAETLRALGGEGDVILLGGTAALGPEVVDAFEEEGHDVTRIAGDSRFSTAIAVAEAANPDPREIVVAFGGDFPDALLAGAVAPNVDGVAVLIDRTSVPGVVQDYIAAHPDARVFTIGNIATEAYPDEDFTATGTSPSLVSGALLGLYNDPDEVVVASVQSFPDGLAGGVYAASRGVPLVLSPKEAVSAGLYDALEAKGPFGTVTLLGGTAALSETVAGQLSGLLR